MSTVVSEPGVLPDAATATPSVWKVLVVDDEPAIHQVTKLALRNISVFGRPLSLISALSAQGAREVLAKHSDIAVILLDVVMESEQAGLELVRHIREELGNTSVRIVLRTGQPGQAPERRVMIDYDINDYKEKTELTANKLFTALTASIRTYRDMNALECCRQGLKLAAHFNQTVFSAKDFPSLMTDLVSQFEILSLFSSIAWCQLEGQQWRAVNSDAPLPDSDAALCSTAFSTPGQFAAQDMHLAIRIDTGSGEQAVLLFTSDSVLATDLQQVLGLLMTVLNSALAQVRFQATP